MSDTESPAPIEDPVPEPAQDSVQGAPPATSDAIGGQINEDTFLGVRLTGPYAGMLLANNPGDPGIAEGVESGLIVPATPIPETPPAPEPDPDDSLPGGEDTTGGGEDTTGGGEDTTGGGEDTTGGGEDTTGGGEDTTGGGV